ncbi:hypothetical protein LTSEMON_6437, partial [Salmonella enterica subsp. enterica serovar Montevideo str. S5-403]
MVVPASVWGKTLKPDLTSRVFLCLSFTFPRWASPSGPLRCA